MLSGAEGSTMGSVGCTDSDGTTVDSSGQLSPASWLFSAADFVVSGGTFSFVRTVGSEFEQAGRNAAKRRVKTKTETDNLDLNKIILLYR